MRLLRISLHQRCRLDSRDSPGTAGRSSPQTCWKVCARLPFGVWHFTECADTVLRVPSLSLSAPGHRRVPEQ